MRLRTAAITAVTSMLVTALALYLSFDWLALHVPGWLNRFQQRFWVGPPHPVARALVEGDEVAGFTVLEVPGHSPGHVAYWRESDRTLILGDVLNGMNLLTGRRGLQEPPAVFTPDPARNPYSDEAIEARYHTRVVALVAIERTLDVLLRAPVVAGL